MEIRDVFPEDYPDFTEFGAPPCSESYPDAFFPQENPPDENGKIKAAAYKMERQAKELCGACPYKERCLAYALENPRESGIWGGTTEIQRKSMRRSAYRARITYPNIW